MPPRDARVRVMDVHAEPVAQEAWRFLLAFFDEVRRMRKRVIVEGGWAVAAYGSPVASVDLDVVIREEDLEGDSAFYDLLHGEGRFARAGAASLVGWSFADFNRAWASTRGYDRALLLDGRTRDVVLQAPGGRRLDVTIPALPALLVMKLKAFRDRSLQFRVMQDPAEVASYDPHDIDQVHPEEAYRLRKAAKDLVDVGHLWGVAGADARTETARLLHGAKLRDLVVQEAAQVDPLVASAADYLIERHGLGGSAAGTLDALRGI